MRCVNRRQYLLQKIIDQIFPPENSYPDSYKEFLSVALQGGGAMGAVRPGRHSYGVGKIEGTAKKIWKE